MRKLIGVLVVLAAPLLQAADADDDVKKELKALQGTWKAVAFEAGGAPIPKDGFPEFTFIVGADGKSTARMGKSDTTATITVNPRKDPRTIDNRHESGASKGKMQYGIYKLEGDKWTVCMTPPGAEAIGRPKDFATKGTTNVVFVFERVKEAK
jgi:uncharacterized protein (TIGR03067 family)